MSYCKNCGNYLPDESQPCSQCGAISESGGSPPHSVPGAQPPISLSKDAPQPGMPPQGAPQPGMPPQGAPQPGMPPQGAPQPGMPPQRAPQPAGNPYGAPQPGMPPQGGNAYGVPGGYPPPGGPPPKKKMSGCAIAAIITGIVVVLAIIGMVVFFFAIYKEVERIDQENAAAYSDYSFDFDELPSVPEIPDYDFGSIDIPDIPDFDSSGLDDEMAELERQIQEAVDGMTEAELDEFIKGINEGAFYLAPEYSQLGLGYFMDEDRGFRDCYLPYGGETDFSAYRAYAKNHGVSIAISANARYANAKEALENTEPEFSPEGVTVLSTYDFGITTGDMDTVGMHIYGTIAELPGGEKTTYMHIVYADIKSGDYYMLGQMTLHGPEFDDETTALLEDMADCYALTLPTDYESMNAYVVMNIAEQEGIDIE